MKSEELDIFTKTALIAVLVNNDFHYMHLLSIGRDFDKSHNLAQDYYDMLDGEVDYLMELALEVKAPIYNYTQAGELIPEYQIDESHKNIVNELVELDSEIEFLEEKLDEKTLVKR